MPRSRLAVWFAVAAVFALACAVLASSAAPKAKAPITVRVEMRDFAFKLSRRSVPAGSTVRFVVHNRGGHHDFAINGKRTRVLHRGQSQTITMTFRRKGRYTFTCRVSGHARLGMKGVFSVGAPAPAPSPPPPPIVVSDAATLTRVGTFERPVLVTAPPGDSTQIFAVEQTGAVWTIRNGNRLTRPFLDLRGHVTDMGESGLLSIAFAPDYERSGRVYAFYNTREGPYGNTRIAEFRRHASDPDVIDPASERALLTIAKPYENHNGGMLQFGPDGMLYASVGDGDPGVLNPAGFFAQRLDSLLGKMLRIDPRVGDPYSIPADNPFVGRPSARPEIWAYGLRNPWRFWIDSETGSTIVPDVGSTSREEVNVVVRGESGLNFGWPCFEGTLVFDSSATCDSPVSPVLEFPRDAGVCAVIGGPVVRDSRLPALAGHYLYGDLCSGKITVVALEGRSVHGSADLGLVVPALTSFGVDGKGQTYVTSANGDVYRLDPK